MHVLRNRVLWMVVSRPISRHSVREIDVPRGLRLQIRLAEVLARVGIGDRELIRFLGSMLVQRIGESACAHSWSVLLQGRESEGVRIGRLVQLTSLAVPRSCLLERPLVRLFSVLWRLLASIQVRSKAS